MLTTVSGNQGLRPERTPRFLRLLPGVSDAASLLHGCQVVTPDGERLGRVGHLMIDARTRQLRYVVLARRRRAAMVVIPWHALYFDSASAQLVFYTWMT